MGFVSLASAVVALAALLVPGLGKYLALGLGIFALGAGRVGYARGRSARARLAGAAGITIGVLALALGALKVGLTLVALDRLERLLSP